MGVVLAAQQRRRAGLAWVLAGLVLISARPLRADDTHYQDFVVGGRAVGMGGAYSSIADDPSGLFYNPAGIADVQKSNLQVSTSLYGFERGSIEDRLTLPVPGVEQLDINFTDIIIVPASAGFVNAFGTPGPDGLPTQAYGVSVVVPSYRTFSAADGDEVRSYQRRVVDREIWTGAGYGRKVGRHLRLGAAAFYVLRSVIDREDVTAHEHLPLGAGQKFHTVTNDITLLNGSLKLLLGAKVLLGERWALGACLQPPSLQLHSQAQLRFSRAVADPSATPQSRFESIKDDSAASQTRHGAVARLGASYQRRYRYALSADVSYHAPARYTLVKVEPSLRNRLPFNPRIERRGVVNFNVGGEFLLIREVSLSAGVFSDFSSAPPIPPSPTGDQPPHVDLLGLTAALGYFGEHTLSRLGVVYSFGKGHDVIPEGRDIDRVLNDQQAFARVNYFQSFFYVFLSSSFRY